MKETIVSFFYNKWSHDIAPFPESIPWSICSPLTFVLLKFLQNVFTFNCKFSINSNVKSSYILQLLSLYMTTESIVLKSLYSPQCSFDLTTDFMNETEWTWKVRWAEIKHLVNESLIHKCSNTLYFHTLALI